MIVLRRLYGAAVALLGSLAALVLIAGVPLALVKGFGWPLPHSVPSWAAISTTLQGSVPDIFWVDTLACIAWAAWTYIVVGLVLEAVATGRGVAAARLRLTTPGQRLAATLIATILFGVSLLGSRGAPSRDSAAPLASRLSTTISAPLRPAVEASRPMDRPAAVVATTAAAELPAQYQVKRGDTLWGISRTQLQDPAKWPEIWRENQGRGEADGRTFTDPNLIQPGWDLTVPTAAEPPASPAPMAAPPVTPALPADTPSAASAAAPPSSTPSAASPQASPAATPPAAAMTSPAPTALPTAQPTPTHPASTPGGGGQQGGALGPPPFANPPRPPQGLPAHHDGAPIVERQPSAVPLPGGGVIGLGVASALLTALAAARLYERRRRRLSNIGAPSSVETMANGQTMSRVRRAVAAVNARWRSAQGDDNGAAGPNELLAAVKAVEDMPGRLPIAAKRGGGDVVVDLDQLSGLCLVGGGAEATARAVIVAALAHHRREDVQLLMLSGLGLAFCPALEETPGVEVLDDVTALITRLEVELIRRGRFLADHDVADFKAAAAGEDPLDTLLAVVPGALIQSAQVGQLENIVSVGRRHGMGLLVVGAPAGEGFQRLLVDELGKIEPGQVPPLLLEARELYRLAANEAAELIVTINAGRGVPVVTDSSGENDDQQAAEDDDSIDADLIPAADAPVISFPAQPKPVKVAVFGRPRVLVRGSEILTRLRYVGTEAMILLVVKGHPLTLEVAVDLIAPDSTNAGDSERWSQGVRDTRRVLRQLTGIEDADFIPYTRAGGYQLDRDLIDADLWQIEAAIKAGRNNQDSEECRAILEQATRDLRGEPLDGANYAWSEDLKEHIRRRGLEALMMLANLHNKASNHEAVLSVVEQALTVDPYSEDLYRRIILAHIAMGREDAARETFKVVQAMTRHHFDGEPDEQTRALISSLKPGRSRATG